MKKHDFNLKLLGKTRHLLDSAGLSSFISSFFAIIIGLFFGLIILLFTNPSQAFAGFGTILSGGFTGGPKGFGNIFYIATPLIMTGLSVGFAFKTGLFNIGSSGQLIVGAYVSVLIGVRCTGLGSLQWLFALFGGMAAGAVWGAVPGILKAFLNVHEVISSIMMNYIGMHLANILVVHTVFDKLRNQSLTVAKNAFIPAMGMDKLFKGSSLNAGFFIAILCAAIIYIILKRTVFGYELVACGHNMEASRYAGINAKKNVVLSMTIAGALSGIAGSLIFLADTGKHIEVLDVLASEGFMGIPVALLGLSNPIGIILSALFIGYITLGGFYMQLYDFVPEIIDIIIASIIYFSAFALIVRKFVEYMKKRMDRKLAGSPGKEG